MRMQLILLSGRSPSASVPQGSFSWIYVGRLVLLVSPAPPAAVPPRRRAPRGCLLPGCLGALTAPAAPWWPSPLVRLPPGRLVPWRAAARSWWRALLCCERPSRRVLLKVLVSPWWQPPPDCLAPGRLGALTTVMASWRRATSDWLVPVAAVSTRWPAALGRLVPDRLAGSVLSGAALESPPVSPRAERRCLLHPLSGSASFPCGGVWVWKPQPEELSLSPGAARLSWRSEEH